MAWKSVVRVGLVSVVALAAACSKPAKAKGPETAKPAPSTAPMNVADHSLEAQVQQAIQDHPSLSEEARNVTVTVDHGTVTLRGTVTTEAEKADIASIASAIPGVTKVDNQLEVKAG